MRPPFAYLPPPPGWAAAWALWLLLATTAVAGVPPGPSPPPAPAAAALATIESTVRGRPALAAAAAAEAAARLPVGSPAQIELLAAEGHFRAQMADAEGSERIARQIETTRTDDLGQAAAGFVRGQWLARHGSLSRADRRFGEALARLPADASASMRLRIVSAQSLVKDSLGRFDEALRLSQQAIAMADASGIAWRRADERSSMAYTLSQVDQVDRGLALNAEAQRIATAAGDLLAMSVAFTVDGILADAKGLKAEQRQAMESAIDHARRAGAERSVVIGMGNLADFHLKYGDPAEALWLTQAALPLARELKDPSAESLALFNGGLALIALGRRDEGLALARQGQLIDERAGAVGALAQMHRELGEFLEKAGHLGEAWASYVEHRKVADEVFRKEQQDAVLELQEAFDAERRQRDLALLASDKSLAQAELDSRNLQQGLYAVGAVGALLFVGVVAAGVRRLRASNHALSHSNAQLEVVSERDPLTGLANRRAFQRAMAHAASDGMLDGSLLLIDIDHFKRINDQHGHATGDAVLVEVAQRLTHALRAQDLTVRWGGEEFLILLGADAEAPEPPAAQRRAQLEALAERLLAAVGSTPVRHGRHQVRVTASIGFASFPLPPGHQPVPWERAVDIVDTAMYLAKAHGRNRAYGVRSLSLEAKLAGKPQAGTLESAWRAGQAELAPLSGPAAEPGTS